MLFAPNLSARPSLADTSADVVRAELERPSLVGRHTLRAVAQASLLPPRRELALLVVGAVGIADAGHKGGNAGRREIVGILQSTHVLELCCMRPSAAPSALSAGAANSANGTGAPASLLAARATAHRAATITLRTIVAWMGGPGLRMRPKC